MEGAEEASRWVLHAHLALARGGHCQGISQVVAILLTFLGEEDAFWALVQLITDEKHAMHGR